jgi:hypothetical protein
LFPCAFLPDITPGLGTFTTFVIYTCLGAQSMGTLLIGIATLRMVVEVDTSQQERAVFHTIGWATGIVLGGLAIASSEFVLKEGIFFVANADRKHDGLGVAVIVIVLFTGEFVSHCKIISDRDSIPCRSVAATGS